MSEWYYTSGGQQVGPVTSSELKQAARSGRLAPTDLVWKDGMAEWSPATKVRGLFEHLFAGGAGGAPGAAPARSTAVAPVANSFVAPAPKPLEAAPPTSPTHEETGNDYDRWPADGNPPTWPSSGHAAPAQQHGQPHVQRAGPAIGYYNPTAGLGARLAANLRGFPPPTGPQDEWPLSDVQIGQFVVTEGHRKHIRNLAGLFQFFFVIGVIGSVIFVLIAVFGLALGGAGRGGAAAATVTFVVAAVVVAFTILYYFAARETRRCRTWPAIVFAVLYGLAILVNFGSVFFAVSSGPTAGPGAPNSIMLALGSGIFGAVIGSIIPAIFLWMCVKALTSIPKFLASPVWAQEVLVASKL